MPIRHFLTVMLGLAATGPVVAQTPFAPIRIALTGTASPSGGNYTGFSHAIINNSGHVAFSASLSGGTGRQAIFTGTPGALQTVVTSGTSAPGGGTYTRFDVPTINDSGTVAFHATLTGTSAPAGVFIGGPGAINSVARQGDSAPGGGTYQNLVSVQLDNTGQVAFRSSTSADPVASDFQSRIFAGTSGAVQNVASVGQSTPSGHEYFFLQNPSTNSSGQIAVAAGFPSGQPISGVFVGTPGELQTVALSTDAVPGGGTLGFMSSRAAINDAGQVAFSSSDNSAPFSPTDSVYVVTSGTVAVAARNGDAAPGGGVFAGARSDIAINNSGYVTFNGSYRDVGSSVLKDAIFAGTPGRMRSLARQGESAPGGGQFEYFSIDPILNDTGTVVFSGWLSGDGVTTANDRGLYAATSDGLFKIARTGDLFDVDPTDGTDFRTISGVSAYFGPFDNYGRVLTDSGLLTYSLSFTDGSSGLFMVQLTPVPEPTTCLALASVGLIGWRLRPRAARRRGE